MVPDSANRARRISSVIWLNQRTKNMADVKPEMKVVEDQQNYNSNSNGDPKNLQELTTYVQSLLQQMQDKFQTMSDQIITRIDDMGNRIDDLEKNIADLMTQAGVEGPDK